MFPHETPESAAHVFRVLRYDAETGLLFWRERQGSAQAGSEAGNIGNNKHRRVGVLGRYFQSHRVVWLLVHGTWPNGMLDHRDRVSTNNRATNLRLADKSLNAQNSGVRSDSRTGFRGVGWSATKKMFRARISVNGQRKILGYFDHPSDAAKSYENARRVYHPNA